MKTIFSELPHPLISDIIQIENSRKNYEKVVEQINKVTTYDEFCPSIREMMNGVDTLSVSQIWGWDENRVMNDLTWLNEIWWNEEEKRKKTEDSGEK
tara:strand:- start:94 stop:384 length:291 start_codon:yes stop_codon:yes gene_type:complete